MVYDFLIVGQGLAGSCCSLQLLKKQKKILVIDNGHKNSASIVAPGLFNPVVFKRLVPSWNAPILFPYAAAFYQEAEKQLNTLFYYPSPLAKLFSNSEEKDFWIRKSTDNSLKDYLDPEVKPGTSDEIFLLKLPFGYGLVRQAGFLHVAIFLNAVKDLLLSTESYSESEFSYSDIQRSGEYWVYKGKKFKNVIFCEGHRATQNPFFPELPFVLTKGEVLEVSFNEEVELDKIYSKNLYIVPTNRKTFLVGATYEWVDLTDKPTEKGITELMEKLKALTNLEFKVVATKAGIRPTVRHRRPMVGRQLSDPSIGILNGLGTKGVLIAPYYSEQLVNSFEHNLDIDSEVDVRLL